MPRLFKVLCGAYGLQVLFFVPGLLGDIYRADSPFWVWEGYRKELRLHGSRLGAVLFGYSYLVLYSTFFAVPCAVLAGLLEDKRRDSGGILLLSAWVFSTCMVFGEALLAFLRGAQLWLLILWIAASTSIIRVCWRRLSSDCDRDNR